MPYSVLTAFAHCHHTIAEGSASTNIPAASIRTPSGSFCIHELIVIAAMAINMTVINPVTLSTNMPAIGSR